MSDQRDWDEAGHQEGIAPKRKMSPEHLQKMAEGRARAMEARAQQTRGRPAARTATAPLPREALPRGQGDPTLEDLERMVESVERGTSRPSREQRGQTETTFDFPEQGKRPGWDYCWWPFKITGQEVDASQMVEYAQGGWIPVPVSHFPSLVPAGWNKPVIERRGCRAFMRPMRLSEEARAETRKHAYEQKANRLAAAQTGDSGREYAPRDPRVTGIDAKIQPLI